MQQQVHSHTPVPDRKRGSSFHPLGDGMSCRVMPCRTAVCSLAGAQVPFAYRANAPPCDAPSTSFNPSFPSFARYLPLTLLLPPLLFTCVGGCLIGTEQDGAGDGCGGWLRDAGVHVCRAGGGALWLGNGETRLQQMFSLCF